MASMEQLARQRAVVVHHVLAVQFHGVAAGSLVEHRFDLAKSTFGKQLVKIINIDVVGNAQVSQVTEFVAVGQVINGNDVVNAAGVETFDQIAADKAGGTGNYDFHGEFLGSRH